MDKLKLAHDYFLRIISNPSVTLRAEDLHSIQYNAWVYADAMKAEADKRISKERPDVLCEVDWSVAPSNAEYYLMRCGEAVWSNGFSTICPAPSFGFTGTHIVERSNGF